MADDPETLWSNLLSGDRATVLVVWESLSDEEQVSIRVHLAAMATDEGWSEAQRDAAQAALDLLDTSGDE